jgi:hypothetical protein
MGWGIMPPDVHSTKQLGDVQTKDKRGHASSLPPAAIAAAPHTARRALLGARNKGGRDHGDGTHEEGGEGSKKGKAVRIAPKQQQQQQQQQQQSHGSGEMLRCLFGQAARLFGCRELFLPHGSGEIPHGSVEMLRCLFGQAATGCLDVNSCFCRMAQVKCRVAQVRCCAVCLAMQPQAVWM